MTTSAKREVRDLASLVGSDVATQAMTAKRNVQRSLERAQSAPANYRDERIKVTTRKLATDYLAAMDAIRAAASAAVLHALQSTLVKRLQSGSALPANATRDQLWVRLLSEYELVTDALSENAIGRYQDRLNDIGRRT